MSWLRLEQNNQINDVTWKPIDRIRKSLQWTKEYLHMVFNWAKDYTIIFGSSLVLLMSWCNKEYDFFPCTRVSPNLNLEINETKHITLTISWDWNRWCTWQVRNLRVIDCEWDTLFRQHLVNFETWEEVRLNVWRLSSENECECVEVIHNNWSKKTCIDRQDDTNTDIDTTGRVYVFETAWEWCAQYSLHLGYKRWADWSIQPWKVPVTFTLQNPDECTYIMRQVNFEFFDTSGNRIPNSTVTLWTFTLPSSSTWSMFKQDINFPDWIDRAYITWIWLDWSIYKVEIQ